MVNTVQILYVESVVECCGSLWCTVLCSSDDNESCEVEEAVLCLAVISLVRRSIFNLTCLFSNVSVWLRVTVPVNLYVGIVMAQYMLCNGLDLHSESIHK